MVLFFVPAALSVRVKERQGQELELLCEAAAIAATLESGDPDLPMDRGAGRVGLYDGDGARSSGTGPSRLEGSLLAARDGRTTIVRRGDERIGAVPVSGGRVLRVSVAASEADEDATEATAELIAVGAAAAGIAALLSAMLTERLARPLVALGERAGRLGDGDFTSPWPPASRVREVDVVAKVLEDSATRMAGLVERERRLASDMSHQLRTPLAGLRVAVETELDNPRADRREILLEALESIDRLTVTAESVLALVREGPPTDARVAVADELEAVRARWGSAFERVGRRLDVALGPSSVVQPRGRAVATVLDVLVDNALQHGSGVVTVRHRVQSDVALVTVSDEGHLERPDDGVGAWAGLSGVGLSLARAVAEADRATLRCRSRSPVSFELALPLSPAADGSPSTGGG